MQNLVVVSSRDHLATVLSSTWPKVENVVGGAHDVRIVFDDQNRVSQVAQVMKNLDEPVRVA